ncbi:MAG: ribosome small subunit-dependent GTPase A [Syntrophomonadaceae bacterium]|jgi:ribosome biogenesis GTPase|nr:ribosome small subunit-dependent GTPase A [Syntrophomonadaceae bacterium]
MPEFRRGLVIKNYSGFYYVQDESGKIIECKTRGKIKKQILSGDNVEYTPLDSNRAILENILPRKNELTRPKVANVGIVLIVMANDKPVPNLPLLDRLLILAYYNHITPYILLNKSDLAKSMKAEWMDYYEKAGFHFIRTSIKTGQGIHRVRSAIKDRIAVLAGPSGAGKSSLLSELTEGQNIKTQEVSKKIGRGKHTTRHVELYPLAEGGLIADTPGFSILDLPSINSQDLTHYYPDFNDKMTKCRFGNCKHNKEADCGIKEAVNNGEIAEFRYENYLIFLEELIANERCYK